MLYYYKQNIKFNYIHVCSNHNHFSLPNYILLYILQQIYIIYSEWISGLFLGFGYSQ